MGLSGCAYICSIWAFVWSCCRGLCAIRLGDPSGRADGVSFYWALPAAGEREALLRGGREKHHVVGGGGASGGGFFFAVRPDVGRWAALGLGAVSVLGGFGRSLVPAPQGKKKSPLRPLAGSLRGCGRCEGGFSLVFVVPWWVRFFGALGAFVGVWWIRGRLLRALEGAGDVDGLGVVGRWPREGLGLLAFRENFVLVLLPSVFLRYCSNTTPIQFFFPR